jgi:phosphate transport system substrate-binding protein
VKNTRGARFAALAAIGGLALAGCGSDNNTATSTTGTAGSASSSSAAGSSESAPATDCPSGTLNAEGSSAQKNAFEEVVTAYNEKCADDHQLQPDRFRHGHQAVQRGPGRLRRLRLGAEDRGEGRRHRGRRGAEALRVPAWNLPMVIGPIAVAYNLDGVDKLVLDAPTLAAIFQGEITTWNDPKIAALNKGVTLPDTAIKPFFRSDESGTTENFTKYLKAAGGDAWTGRAGQEVLDRQGRGQGEVLGCRRCGQGHRRRHHLRRVVLRQGQRLGMAQIDNGSGAVELTGDSIGKFIATAAADGRATTCA